MFISPIKAIEEGWITHPECKTIEDWKQRRFISPNAIDFTLDTVHVLGSCSNPFIANQKDCTIFRPLIEVQKQKRYHCQCWFLHQGHVYDGLSNMYVTVPSGHVAILYTRSTFARNGVFLVSGLYDSGYIGACGFTIYPIGGNIDIEVGVRIGQIAFVAANNAGIYAGGYNHAPGTHWVESSK